MSDMYEDAPPRRRQRQEASARVPPHNLAAEESLLGAMLLSRDAIASAVEIVSADDFYKPAHGHIFDAVTSLFAAGEPVDPVTVGEELARAGLLEAIGGPATLVTIQSNTPATTSAARYARIVEEHALLRRLIGVGGEIAELGFDVPDDVAKAVDQAESMVFRVAQRRVTDTMAPIGQLLGANLDRLEQLYERGEQITGLPTGYIDLDEILSGLQPSNLVVVGARPAMGKALALDTPIPTPIGWTTMAAVQPGEQVFDEKGLPCTVVAATPVQHDHECFRVEFDDGSSIVADADHRWVVERKGDDQLQVRTTRELHNAGNRDWHVPVTNPLELPDAELPVDPYVLGWQLGTAAYSALHPVLCAESRVFQGFLHTEGIPASYLRASAKQRLTLMHGLLDGAGLAGPGVDLCLTDRRLLAQVRELVCSLGEEPSTIRSTPVRSPEGSTTAAWTLTWTLLTQAGKRAIAAITPVPSVPVRCIAVNSPSHMYLAGESMIPTHNTSFALGIATHAAVEASRPVLLFSLEMSQLELSQRILCAEARVDSTKVRTGRLGEADWTKISHAVGRLAEAPIFIDDNPNVTVMEIRAKARRLKSKVGDLGAVLIDYVQLMMGRSNAESRQVEVSEISRSLKILARELETPVVALAQLNRQLETRADKRPMLADLRESGCLTADARLLRADTNAEVTLGELVASGERDVPVWSLDDSWQLVPATLTHAFPSGTKPVFRLRLASGCTVDATANHRFRTIDGWVALGDLRVGDRLAVPRAVPPPDRVVPMDDNEVVLLAHLLGDGCVLARQPIHYTSADEANLAVVEEAARRRFGITPRRVRQDNWWHVYLPSPHHLTHGHRNPISEWWRTFGLGDCRSWQKFIPERVQQLPKPQVEQFLRHLWATDGSVVVTPDRPGPPVRVQYHSTSRALVDGVRRLLLRLGIQSRVYTVRQGVHRPGHLLRIEGVTAQRRFLSEVGVHGARGERAAAALKVLSGLVANPNVDTIPWQVRDQVVAAMVKARITHRRLAQELGEQYCGSYMLGSVSRPRSMRRERLGRIASIVRDKQLAALAESDVLWDRIVAIAPIGDEPVYDATVLGTHNFIANGIVAHNSLEQDSDVVLFIYRDEVYNAETPDRGTAEIIVAKHRNGPTGKARLAWLDHYTKFANMARG